MSVGSVGMLRPSGNCKFSRGAMNVTIPAIINVVPTYFTVANPQSWLNFRGAFPMQNAYVQRAT